MLSPTAMRMADALAGAVVLDDARERADGPDATVTLSAITDSVAMAPDAMVAFTLDGTVRVANGRAEAMYEVEPGALVGCNIGDLLCGHRNGTGTTTSGGPFRFRMRRPKAPLGRLARRGDGGERVVEATFAPVWTVSGIHVLAALRHGPEERIVPVVGAGAMGTAQAERISRAWSSEERAAEDACVAAPEGLVAHVTLALDDVNWRTMQAETARIGQFALGIPSAQAVFGEVVRTVARTLRAESCWLSERLPDGSLALRAHVGAPACRPGLRVRDDPPDPGDGTVEPALCHSTAVARGGSTRVPIGGCDPDLGELGVAMTNDRLLTAEELGFLHAVANTVATTIRRSRSDAELARLALHDSLTELPNRAFFLERLGGALSRSAISGLEVAVVFVDLDHFKLVNDGCGHSSGDRLLVEVASRLRRATGNEHTVARLGGDEFGIVCEDVSVADLGELAERVASALSDPIALERGSTSITASVGVASARAGTSAEDLLRQADTAMYAAKASGRDGVAFFDEEMHARAVERLELESGIRQALERRELVAFYQPVYALSGGLVGVEALARWSHPTRGVLTPDLFIGVAEETGVIGEVGAFMLETTCAQLRAWRACEELRDLCLSVNVSALELSDPALPARVAHALERNGLAPDVLQLEVTETALMRDRSGAIPLLQRLRELGVRIAIDDFGTGYSSLLYLRSLPADTIKIDRAFVAGIGRHGADLAIVRSVTELAHVLGMRTIAEGVERAEQVDALRELGCDMAQGYIWSAPLPGEALEELLVAGVGETGVA